VTPVAEKWQLEGSESEAEILRTYGISHSAHLLHILNGRGHAVHAHADVVRKLFVLSQKVSVRKAGKEAS
jgi:hypothetical protein